jgi:hypothetical protein
MSDLIVRPDHLEGHAVTAKESRRTRNHSQHSSDHACYLFLPQSARKGETENHTVMVSEVLVVLPDEEETGHEETAYEGYQQQKQERVSRHRGPPLPWR